MTPAPKGRSLRAGPVTCELDGADIRAVRFGGAGGRELAQRVYVAIRDEAWGTVPGVLSDLHVEQADDSFTAAFRSRHREGGVDFTWDASIVGSPDGTIRFRMVGVAGTAFRYAKIGFNVHHGLLESTGRRYRAVAEDGSTHEGILDDRIEPQRVVEGRLTAMFEPYRSLTIEYLGGAEVRFGFSGDLFEMQDHRNWADGNFKSYGTPLAVPWPMHAEPGLRIEQEIEISSSGLVAALAVGRPISASVGGALGPLPLIGLSRPTGSETLGPREVELLSSVRPAHLRIALDLRDPSWRRELARGAADCQALGAAAEFAVSSSEGDEEELRCLADELRAPEALGLRIARILVLERQHAFTPVAPITSAGTVARVRAALASLRGVPFAGGSDQFFSDVNRDPPAAEGLDAVCFGLCPQVHAADDASVMENLAALPDTVGTARLLLPGLDVVVSPVTLAARLGPYPGGAPEADDPPGSVDVRLQALYGASWTLGAVAWLAEAEPAAITFFDTAGPTGLIAGETPASYADLLPARPGEAHPVLHVLADVAGVPDAIRLAARSSAPLQVGILALRGEAGDLVLLANHTPEPRTVQLSGLEPSVVVRVLDEETAVAAMGDALAFRTSGARRDVPDATLELTLGPYAYVSVAQGAGMSDG